MALAQYDRLHACLKPLNLVDLAPASIAQRMLQSEAEIALICAGVEIADIGGYAICVAIKYQVRELDIAIAGRAAMELAIAERFPDTEYRDTWFWFQSGLKTDGAYKPVTARKVQAGGILSLTIFPMISAYYTALERTLFLGEVDPESLKIWQANIAAHELGMGLPKPGMRCSQVTERINQFF